MMFALRNFPEHFYRGLLSNFCTLHHNQSVLYVCYALYGKSDLFCTVSFLPLFMALTIKAEAHPLWLIKYNRPQYTGAK